MRSSWIVAAFAAFTQLCLAAPTPSTYTIHEKRASNPRLWTRGSRIDGNAILPIRIGLTQSNIENGEAYLMDVSHPDSLNYGKHWTQETVHSVFAPSDDTVRTVRAWLVASGIDEEVIIQSDNKGWLAFNIPARQAEDLFQTEYYEHVRANSGSVRVGSDEYSLPQHIREHVDFISPGVKLSASLTKTEINRSVTARGNNHRPGPIKQPNPSGLRPWKMPLAAASLPADIQNCGRNITPPCLKALYQIPDAHLTDDVNQLGLYESADMYAQEDLNLFFAKYAPNVPQGTHPLLDSIDGGEAPVSPFDPTNGGESDIDMEIAYSLVYPQSVTLYQVDDAVEQYTDLGFNTFLDALDGSYCNYTAYGVTGDTAGFDAVYPDPAQGGYKGKLQCGTYTPTRVISVSYGRSEYDAPANYTRRQCNEFLKLGLQGHTFVWASGDFGVASFPGDDSSNGCLGQHATIYNPSFPTCPWVTNVGATRLYDNQTVLDRESAMQDTDLGLFASSGGFANYFPAPSYQEFALKHYFAHHDPGHPSYIANANATNIGEGDGVYNRAGRGFPDVSANGAQLRSFNAEQDTASFGTSLAAPIWGSIMTLINEERTAVGKGPVGFINPVLYANPGVFNDIVSGSNPGCGSSGFSAVEGWDPVTGLGTPKYPKLLSLFLALP